MDARDHLDRDVGVQLLGRLWCCLLPGCDISLSLNDKAHARLIVLRSVRIGLQRVMHSHIRHGLITSMSFRLIHGRIGDH